VEGARGVGAGVGRLALVADLVTGPALSTTLLFRGGGGGADASSRRLASALLFSLLFSLFLCFTASDLPLFEGGALLARGTEEGLGIFPSLDVIGGGFLSFP